MVIVSEDSAEESCGELNGRNNGLNKDSVICDARCWPQNKRDLLPIAFRINLWTELATDGAWLVYPLEKHQRCLWQLNVTDEISDALGLMRGKRQLVFLKYAVSNKIGTRPAIRGDFYKSLKNTSLYGLRSSQYFGSKLWNTISLFIRVANSVPVFWSKLISHIIDSYEMCRWPMLLLQC